MKAWAIEIAIGVAVAIALGFLCFQYLDHVERRGYDRAVSDGSKARQEASDAALATERDLRERLRVADKQRFENEAVKDETIDSLRRAATAGTVRLRCPSSRPVSASAAPATGPATAGPGERVEPDVMPAVAADIFGIVGDINKIVRQRDEVVRRYEEARRVCNAP